MPQLKKLVLLLGIILLAISGFWVWRRFTTSPPASVSTTPQSPYVQIGATRYTVEIRDDDQERAQGLSGKPSLGADQGMLFLFPQKSQYSFWMKDMQFPIDMIWIDGDTIVDISENVPIPIDGNLQGTVRVPKAPVDKVLEINAGDSKKNNIVIGSKVILWVN